MSSKELQWNAVTTNVLVRGVICRYNCTTWLDSAVLLYVTQALISKKLIFPLRVCWYVSYEERVLRYIVLLVGLCNRDAVCLLLGRKSVFVSDLYFRLLSFNTSKNVMGIKLSKHSADVRVLSEPGGIRWSTGGEVKGKLANGVGCQYSQATSERGISIITEPDAYTSAASSRLNWRPHRFKWTRPFRGKTNSGFCACAITFRTS